MSRALKSAAAIGLAAAVTISLGACDSNHSNAADSTSLVMPKIANDKTSKPLHDKWTPVFANDKQTLWRCAGTTLLIRRTLSTTSSPDSMTSVASYPECIDASHPAPTVG